MNRKQWVLLITMSTVLITSAITLVLLILSELPVDDHDAEPYQLEKDDTEANDAESLDSEESAEENINKDPAERDAQITTPAEDETETVDDHFEKLQETESADENESKSDGNQRAEENNGTQSDIKIQDPQLPEEPEVDFETPN